MGDVSDILGFGTQATTSNSLIDEANKILNERPRGLNAGLKAVKKPKGMSREVFSLLGADGLVPMTQGNKANPAPFKSKRSSAVRGKWIWAPFTNPARGDDFEMYHWIKSDIQSTEYPYAKFNITLDPITFSDEEYNQLLACKGWNKDETLHVINLVSKYSLKWPVITDRYELEPCRSQEELQARYYSVISRLREYRLGLLSGSNLPDYAKDDHQLIFNLENEKRRKYQLEMAYRKTREDEFEEQQLREELKCIEALLKKAKKVSMHDLQAKPAPSSNSSIYSFPKDPFSSSNEASFQNIPSSLPSENVPSAAVVHPSGDDASNRGSDGLIKEEENVSIHHPTPGRPYLQSARLIVTEAALGIPKLVTKKLNTILQDLGAPEHPLPTKAITDLYDQVRQEAIALIALQGAVAAKEKQLAGYRALQKQVSISGYETFQREVTMPQSALLCKLPAEGSNPNATLSSAHSLLSSPTRPPAMSPHDYGDLIGTLGLALLTAEANPVVETENSGTSVAGSGTSATTTKKATKRKSSAVTQPVGSDGSTAPGTGPVEGGISSDQLAAVKKPAPKRSKPNKPKPEGSTGGMDSAAIADAAARAVGTLTASYDMKQAMSVDSQSSMGMTNYSYLKTDSQMSSMNMNQSAPISYVQIPNQGHVMYMPNSMIIPDDKMGGNPGMNPINRSIYSIPNQTNMSQSMNNPYGTQNSSSQNK